MVVHYRIRLKDRENPKSKMQFITTAFPVDDIEETAHTLLLKYTDYDCICYSVEFIEISIFSLGDVI